MNVRLNKSTLRGFITMLPLQKLYPVFHKVLRWLDRLGWVPSGTTTYLGHPFVYPLDSGIGRQIARGEEWDATLGVVISALLSMDEPVICEVGSNIGASLLQIKKVKPLAYIIAFEPSDRFRPFLERNLELAAIKRAEVSPLLLGRQQGTIWLYNTNSSASVCVKYEHGSSSRRKGPRRKQLTTMTTLDEVFCQRPRVDFIKVDTDGFDFQVISGAEATLKRDSPILYFELWPAAFKLASKLSMPVDDMMWLQSIGYRRFVCFTPSGELKGVTDNAEQAVAWAETKGYCDILACPDGSPYEARVESLLRQLRISAAVSP
jgi:FkbM family methyltransferase